MAKLEFMSRDDRRAFSSQSLFFAATVKILRRFVETLLLPHLDTQRKQPRLTVIYII